MRLPKFFKEWIESLTLQQLSKLCDQSYNDPAVFAAAVREKCKLEANKLGGFK